MTYQRKENLNCVKPKTWLCIYVKAVVEYMYMVCLTNIPSHVSENGTCVRNPHSHALILEYIGNQF